MTEIMIEYPLKANTNAFLRPPTSENIPGELTRTLNHGNGFSIVGKGFQRKKI